MSKNLKIIPLLLLILLFLVGCGQADSVQGRQFEDAELKEDSKELDEEDTKQVEEDTKQVEEDTEDASLDLEESTSTNVEQNSLLEEYSKDEIEYTRILLMTDAIDSNSPIIYVSHFPAGSPIAGYSDGSLDYPYDVTHLSGEFTAQGSITYTSHGDGSITIYPLPSHWHQEDQSEEGYREYTQEVLDNAETVNIVPGNDEDVVNKIESVEFIYD